MTLKTYRSGSLNVKGESTVQVRYGKQHSSAKIIVVSEGFKQDTLAEQ